MKFVVPTITLYSFGAEDLLTASQATTAETSVWWRPPCDAELPMD